MNLSSQLTNSKARATIKYEPVDLAAEREKKIAHDSEHPKNVTLEEFNETLSPSDHIELLSCGESSRNHVKRKRADGEAVSSSPSRTEDDDVEMPIALRMRAVNARLPPRHHLNHSDRRRTPKKPNTRSSTLYKKLKKDEYYWY